MRILRAILLAILLSFVIGLVIGTLIRQRMNGPPVRYIGAIQDVSAECSARVRSAASSSPLDVT